MDVKVIEKNLIQSFLGTKINN